MKKVMLFFAAIAMATSCTTQDEVQTSSARNSMKVFKNAEEYQKTLNEFNAFESGEDFQEWSSRQAYKPLYNAENFVDQDKIPYKLMFILNEDKQFQIGDKLISLSNDGTMYQSTIDENGKVSKEKTFFGKASVQKVATEENESASQGTSRVDVDANGGNYKEGWDEFNRVSYATGCNTPSAKGLRFRLVHYLVVENIDGPYFVQSNLMFKLRMSQYNNGSWVYNNTTTERLYNFNVSGDYKVVYKPTNTVVTNFGTGTFYESGSNGCSTTVKGTLARQLAFHNFAKPVNLDLYKWDVALSGYVYHKVNGDVEANAISTNVNW